MREISSNLRHRYRALEYHFDLSAVDDAVHDACVSLLVKGLPLEPKMVTWGAGHYVGNTVRKSQLRRDVRITGQRTGISPAVGYWAYRDLDRVIDITWAIRRRFKDRAYRIIRAHWVDGLTCAEISLLYPDRSAGAWAAWFRHVAGLLRADLQDYGD